jgi:hypothetical protein
MLKPNIKYRVTLTGEEREALKRLIQKGHTAGYRIRHAPVIKIDGQAEAKIVTLACSEPPEGRSRWTLHLLADQVAALGILDSISDNGIRNLLKKMTLNHGRGKNGVFLPRPPSSLRDGRCLRDL